MALSVRMVAAYWWMIMRALAPACSSRLRSAEENSDTKRDCGHPKRASVKTEQPMHHTLRRVRCAALPPPQRCRLMARQVGGG